MTKPKTVSDATLRKWRWSPNRKDNSVELNVLGITATISKKQEVSFLCRMTINGHRPSRTIGQFVPGEYGIEEAMKDAQVQRQKWRDIAEGRELEAPTDVPTFKGLLDKWESYKADSLSKMWKTEERNLIEKVYAPINDGRSMLVLKRIDLENCHSAYLTKRFKDTGKRPLTSIRRAYNCVKPVLEYARDHRWTRPELLTGFKTGLKKEPARKRMLTPREWQLAAPAIDALPKDNGIYMRFLFATAARLAMPSTMRWKDIRQLDVGTFDDPKELTAWCVPAAAMKGAYEAVFPIVGESARIIEKLRAEAGGKPKADAFVFPDSPRKAWTGNADYWQKEVFTASGTKGWHRHDLRRTAASLLKYVGANMDDVKLLLDHRERDDDDSDTPRYVIIEDNGPALLALAAKLEEMHALVKQIEEGRDSKQLRGLYSALQRSPKVMAGLAKADIDLDTMLQIVPDQKHGKGKVAELRAAK